MNKLFKDGDYVLLSDCKAFDDKYGLAKDTTMWAVARKMEGGEPNKGYMQMWYVTNCVGVFNNAVGVWKNEDLTETRLSVEDVIYRSEDGMTLDELSKIPGAFEEGKEYECVVGTNDIFNEGAIYKANGEGIKDEHSFSIGGHTAKFKPVTTKSEWVPKVGEYVMVGNTPKLKYMYIGLNSSGSAVCESLQEKNLGQIKCFHLRDLKPIDQERERVIKKCNSIWRDNNNGVSGSEALQLIETLYDAGMLKEGDK